MIKLEDLQHNVTVRGLLLSCIVTVVSVEWYGTKAFELTHKTGTVRSNAQIGTKNAE